jgi:hypothetical protein
MLSQTQVSCAPAGRQVIQLFQQHWWHLKGTCDLNSAFEKADRLLEQKRTGSQFHYIAPLHYKANILCNVSAWL